MTEHSYVRAVGPGEAARVVAAYQRAEALASRVRALMVAAGLPVDRLWVVPSLTDACEPVVYVTALGPVGRQLASIVVEARPPPDAGGT